MGLPSTCVQQAFTRVGCHLVQSGLLLVRPENLSSLLAPITDTVLDSD